MKKKFLSLMMAAAVVATTSVSAFADVEREGVTYPDSANVITRDDRDAQQNVTITGKVMDENGNMPADTFKVTVPTAASFTVNQYGVFVGPTLEVKNSGSQTVEVSAQSFTRIGIGSGGITVASEEEIETANAQSDEQRKLDRKTVSLKLVAEGSPKAYLSPGKSTGVFAQRDLTALEKPEDGVKLLTLDPGTESKPTKKAIELSGSAGTKSVSDSVSDEFRLTLKIKKVVKSSKRD